MTNETKARPAGFRSVTALGLLLLGLLAVPAAVAQEAAAAQDLVVRHIQSPDPADTRSAYFVQVLELALSKTDGAFQLEPVTMLMTQQRALRLVDRGVLSVLWTMTSAEREDTYRPIRVPLYDGLIGHRLLLIRCEDQDRFGPGMPLDTLRAMPTAQGIAWPDTPILRHNGFQVAGIQSYDALFRMLQRRRIAFFPRSVLEVGVEAARFADRGLCIERHLALQYPAYFYFFVRSDNDVLAERLEEGLRRAQADGSFEALFETHFGPLLDQARLDERTTFMLENPLLDATTPTPAYR